MPGVGFLSILLPSYLINEDSLRTSSIFMIVGLFTGFFYPKFRFSFKDELELFDDTWEGYFN